MRKPVIFIVLVVVAILVWWLYQAGRLNFFNGTENVNVGECYVGGCSRQICSDNPDAVSTCEYREEYACYQNAKCERQSTGECGWTSTPELQVCLGASL